MSCTDARQWVSARLDGEHPADLDEHLAECAECRRFAESAEGLRRALRVEAVDTVPDIAGPVRARLEAEREAERTTPVPLATRRRNRSTVAVAAAALLAGVLIGANLAGIGTRGTPPVLADTLPGRVAAAQTTVEGLHEEVRLVERGWHPEVPERTFAGTLDYRAPESLALEWQDETNYPSGEWRPNDVTLHTDGRRWSATGLQPCASSVQPGCSVEPRERAVVDRPPFADDRPVPLELIVPVRSFSRVDTARVVGEGEVAGRPTVEVTVVAAQVGPLLAGLAPAGNLRTVHPTDEVHLSLDAERMIPLALRVTASGGADRLTWARSRGYADHPGLVVLELQVTSVDLDVPPADRFTPPANDDPTDAGFREGPTGVLLDPEPPDGFSPGRTGRIAGATPTGVWSWTDGRAWIRLQATTAWEGVGLFGFLEPLVRPEPLGDGQVYVGADGRVGLHADGLDVVVDGSVSTAELLEVVEGLGLRPAPLPEDWPEHRTASRAAIRQAVPGALGLAVDGFERPVARLDGDGVVLVAVGAGDRLLRLVQVPGTRVRLPLETDYEAVAVRGQAGRYAPGSGRLEWVEDGLVLTLQGTGLTQAELLAAAEGLVPL